MHLVRKIALLLISMLTGCSGPGFFKQDGEGAPVAEGVEIKSDSNGILVATFAANSTESQSVSASAGSNIASASVTVPPGALAVGTEITIEEGGSLLAAADVGELGISGSDDVDGAANAVVISSSDPNALTGSLSISVPLPEEGTGLTGRDYSRLAVLYKRELEDGTFELGILPKDEITVEGNVAKVTTDFFGVFQAVITRQVVTARKKAATKEKIVTAVERAAAAVPGAFEIHDPSTTESTLQASWTSAANASFYRVVISGASDCSSIEHADSTSETSLSFSGLTEGTYYLCVAAINKGQQTAASNQGLEFAVGTSSGDVDPPTPQLHVEEFSGSTGYTVHSFGGEAYAEFESGRVQLRQYDQKDDDSSQWGFNQSHGTDWVGVDSSLQIVDPGKGRELPNANDSVNWLHKQDLRVLLHLDEAALTNTLSIVNKGNPIPPGTVPNATITTVAAAQTAGFLAGAMDFHISESRRIEIDSGSFLDFSGDGSTELTVSFMFQMPALTDNSGSTRLFLFHKGESYDGYGAFINDLGEIGFAHSSGNGSDDDLYETISSGAPAYDDDAWHHLVVTFKGPGGASSDTDIYVDGVKIPMGPLVELSGLLGTFSTTRALTFGARYLVSSYIDHFTGLIDEIAVWDRVLTGEEVNFLFRQHSSHKSGVYQSAQRDVHSDSAQWLTLSYQTVGPAGIDLPDNGTSETSADFAVHRADFMSNNTVLLHLDEISGSTASDSSGNASNATRSGTNGFNNRGVFKKAWENDGARHLEITSGPTLSGGNSFSLSAWVRPYKLPPSGQWAYIISSASGPAVYTLKQNDGGGYTFYLDDNAYSLAVTSTDPPAPAYDGRWQHLVATWNSGTKQAKLYLNGAEVASGTESNLSGTLGNSSSIVIGAQTTGNAYPYVGLFDEIAFFDVPLSAAQVDSLFYRGNNNIGFQVRSATLGNSSNFSVSPFMGPAGGIDKFFSPNNADSINLPGGGSFDLSGLPTGRYFEYQVTLQQFHPSAGHKPQLKAVWFGPPHYINPVGPAIENNTAPHYSSIESITVIYDETVKNDSNQRGDALFQLSPDGATWYGYNGTAWVSGGPMVSESLLNSKLGEYNGNVGGGQLFFRMGLDAGSDVSEPVAVDELRINYIP